MRDNPIDPTGALAELSLTLRADRSVSDILNDVVGLARRRIPGTEEASITLLREGDARTVATTGALAVELDELQYQCGYGPCMDAGRANELMLIADSARETRWPGYVPAARERGLGSSLSLPIPVENYLVGALNLYSRSAGSFSAEVLTLGDALSAHITAALSWAESVDVHRSRALNLEAAMAARSVIEQAKGIIMAQQKCTSTVAFEQLRTLSKEQNMKLRDLASSLVTKASGHPVHMDAGTQFPAKTPNSPGADRSN